MTRNGAKQRPWTTAEIAFLKDSAGLVPRREICRRLHRGKRAVENKAQQLGLSLRCHVPKLAWCDDCATWRGYLDADGRCRVCRMKDQLQGREAACADAMAAMDPTTRRIYEDAETKRQSRRLPLKPRKHESCPMSRYERSKAETRYLLDIEDWQYQCLKLQYDAAKTRLRRMREKTGTNPRKK